MKTTRREFLQAAGWSVMAGSTLGGMQAHPAKGDDDRYLQGMRILLAEGYNPPFYPNLDYDPNRALEIARALNADSIRIPGAAYRCFFPTRSAYPRHPDLRDRDLLGATVDLFHRAGLKVVLYMPLNHPFLSTSIATPAQMDWVKKNSDGRPMQTEHYGFDPYYETCINSPVREEILKMVAEACAYDVDIVYFDGPYQGMQADMRWCQCGYCRAAYRKALARDLPAQGKKSIPEEEWAYVNWLRDDVMAGFMKEVKRIVKRRPVPMLFNDTSLLSSRQWRNLLYPMFDGFMFESATTPEQKLFNILMGKSTGAKIWSYVGSHTLYNREHLKNQRVRGWFSYPMESDELRMDASMAMAAGAGLIYWGLARFHYMPDPVSQYESARHIRGAFDFAAKNRQLIETLQPVRDFGILVSGRTIDWFEDRGPAYENYYYGAFQVLKDLDQQAEPFHDSQLTPEKLKRYRAVWAPNAVCLSDSDCRVLSDYVHGGGRLIATHRTSLADERGRARAEFGLKSLLGASYEALMEYPDLYLKLDGSLKGFPGNIIPQDPQILKIKAASESEVIARHFDRGRDRDHGPALVRRDHVGRGSVIYLASGLDATYLETRAPVLLRFFSSLLAPWTKDAHYSLQAPVRLWGHLTETADRSVLHIFADTGNKWKKLQAREQFVPVGPVSARIRAARPVRRAWLWSSGKEAPWHKDGEFVTFRLEQVDIHEGIVLEYLG